MEFGARAAAEVSKDVAETVLMDTLANTWDVYSGPLARKLSWESAAKVLENPAVTIPFNKGVSAGRLLGNVLGGSEADAKDLGQRIDAIYEDIYGRRR